MANHYYTFAEHEFYHVYNRGNSKQLIFKNESDFDRFNILLYIANWTERFTMREFDDVDIFDIERKNRLVDIGAYCLMPNHFHILISPIREGGVPQFMLKLATAYSSYFNKKYSRTGGLFEGSYKAQCADSDKYLKYLFSYIHLNPFRKDEDTTRSVNQFDLHSYRHSSLPDYLGETREEGKILSREAFPKYFGTIKDQERELMEWLDYKEI